MWALLLVRHNSNNGVGACLLRSSKSVIPACSQWRGWRNSFTSIRKSILKEKWETFFLHDAVDWGVFLTRLLLCRYSRWSLSPGGWWSTVSSWKWTLRWWTFPVQSSSSPPNLCTSTCSMTASCCPGGRSESSKLYISTGQYSTMERESPNHSITLSLGYF